MTPRNRRLAQISPTLSVAFKKYLEEVSSGKKSYEQERSLVRVWEKTFLAERPIATIKNRDLIRIRDEWATHIKPATIIRRFAILSHLYTVAIKDWLWSYLEVNPVQLIRKPKVDNVRNRRLYEKIKIQGLDIKDYPKDEITTL